MKLCAFSDSHNQHNKLTIPECDVLICAGDVSNFGYEHEVRAFSKWFNQQPSKHKIFIPGNHEVKFEEQLPLSMTWLNEECPDINILIDKELIIDGVKFYGSPWTPFFHDWAFNKYRGEDINKYWINIPDDVNVLITHGPPYGILDEVVKVDGSSHNPKRLVGCEMLKRKVDQMKPDVHLFGHIHCASGQEHINGTSYYNVAVCDEIYYPSNPVTLIEL